MHGFRPFDEKPSPTYSLTSLHVNYGFHKDMKKGKQGGMLSIGKGMDSPCVFSFFYFKHNSFYFRKMIYYIIMVELQRLMFIVKCN